MNFPRVYELMDMLVDLSHPDAYFQDFEKVLKDKSGLYEFRKVEGWLAALDDAAWQDLKQRARPAVAKARERTWLAGALRHPPQRSQGIRLLAEHRLHKSSLPRVHEHEDT